MCLAKPGAHGVTRPTSAGYATIVGICSSQLDVLPLPFSFSHHKEKVRELAFPDW
jgi:hypothetical protein